MSAPIYLGNREDLFRKAGICFVNEVYLHVKSSYLGQGLQSVVFFYLSILNTLVQSDIQTQIRKRTSEQYLCLSLSLSLSLPLSLYVYTYDEVDYE